VDATVAEQVAERAGAEGITLPGEFVDRIRYAFL
jgi:hypothetical protein